MIKFTFRTEKATGQWRSFQPDHHYIKLKGYDVGSISDEKPHKIRFTVKRTPTPGKPAPFKWVSFKNEFNSVLEAKQFLIQNTEKIINLIDLYQMPK